MFIIRATDRDAEGKSTSIPTPRSAHSLNQAQSYMVQQAGKMLEAGDYQVSVLSPASIVLSAHDGTGSTSFVIEAAHS